MNAYYKNLVVWQMGMRLCHQVYNIAEDEKFPKNDDKLDSQLKRAVVSIPANIAEGASSHFEKHFLSYVNIAFCSLKELETLLLFCHQRGYIDSDNYLAIHKQADKLGVKLYSLLKQIEKRVKKRDLIRYGMESFRRRNPGDIKKTEY